VYHAINDYQLRLDVQRFLSGLCINLYYLRVLYFASWGVITVWRSKQLMCKHCMKRIIQFVEMNTEEPSICILKLRRAQFPSEHVKILFFDEAAGRAE